MMLFGAGMGGFTQLFSAVNSVVGTLKQTAVDLAEMDDIYSNVRKTTLLTQEQVDKLNDSFKKMDTRTSREQLNNLAYIAGKLGISAEDLVKQFVEASDIINIAMNDVLGEDATLFIGKMTDVYQRSTEILQGVRYLKKVICCDTVPILAERPTPCCCKLLVLNEFRGFERKTRLELATPTLARSCSTN